ncbi:hypothetical protein JTE90_009664 [Oedothorax gibbosus]|uniref:Transcription factor Adf-1 n=1 Tax=Oedothorax gibbosus TaxID=931172 RepID=A0AAV6TPL6_9ARAC|nr:hypothetical protein JTE90_009664 [Oedothorax gibbosus]
MEKKLISQVFEHDLLYAVDSVHYRDRHMRAVAWTEIGKELGMPGSQCKDTWRKLRNCYLNAINRRQNKNTSIPKWKYEDEMSFLLPFIEVRSSSENDNEPGLGHISDSYTVPTDSDLLPEREDSMEMILPEPSTFIPKKERDEEDNGDMYPLSRRRQVSRPMKSQEKMPRDETELFFLSISETVKRLPAVDQARIKMELCKLVFGTEIRHLEAEYEETL